MKYRILTLLLVAFAIIIILVFLFREQTDLYNSKNDQLMSIAVNKDFPDPDSQPVYLNIDQINSQTLEKILSILSQCIEQRTLSRSNAYHLSDIQYFFAINTKDGLKFVQLGNVNTRDQGYGTTVFTIKNHEEIIQKLSAIL